MVLIGQYLTTWNTAVDANHVYYYYYIYNLSSQQVINPSGETNRLKGVNSIHTVRYRATVYKKSFDLWRICWEMFTFILSFETVEWRLLSEHNLNGFSSEILMFLDSFLGRNIKQKDLMKISMFFLLLSHGMKVTGGMFGFSSMRFLCVYGQIKGWLHWCAFNIAFPCCFCTSATRHY